MFKDAFRRRLIFEAAVREIVVGSGRKYNTNIRPTSFCKSMAPSDIESPVGSIFFNSVYLANKT